MKILGVRVMVKAKCTECNGRGKEWYSTYHDESVLEPCSSCRGKKVTTHSKLLTLSELAKELNKVAK